MNFTLPEMLRITQCHEPVVANGLANTADVISCKGLHKLWVVLHHYYGGNTNLVLTINESVDVSGSPTAAITETCPIWYNVDTSLSDLLTRDTDGYTFTVDTGAGKDQIWVLEWDPAKFSVGKDCFQLRSSGGHGSSIVQVMYFGLPRYMSDVVPTAITD